MKKNIPSVGLVSGLTVLALLAVAGWWFWLRTPPLPDGLIQVNGRIEGDHYAVAGKMPGKVADLPAREGDSTQKGKVLARLDDAQVRARLDQARQAASAMEAQWRAAQTALAVARKDLPLAIQTAEANLAHARAQFASARSSAEQAARDAERFRRLAEAGTVDRHRYEQMALATEVAANQARSAEEAVRVAERQLAQARLGDERLRAREDEVKALAAQLDQARAALNEADSVLADLAIVAPADGIITQRLVNVGEVVAAGAPLFDIVDLDRLYLKAYVPEKDIGKVRLGLPAQVYTDAFPERPFPATVRYIASRAEFTPKEVQTPDERVKLVYAVKLYLDANPEHRLTPGLPADAIIRWREDSPWAKPRR
ncbi:HlyD family efflux transporter periplasmic adaptor subunit [Azoarcus communis]|uniref:HlyD family efflux transporter periplasmic adaptor subunit n=1 Tax=Parazoarcus communis TaxID=41977 RepID=UPI0014597E20|nr:HlyD family efflux transporter periplasmic adaptor subunit [Parazoarcus communis]